MDDTPALRLTLRRCTALVLVALGLLVANTRPYGPSDSLGYPLAYAAVGYLALSTLGGLLHRGAEPADAGGDSDDTVGDDEGGGGGDAEPASEESDDDGSDDPPAGTFVGHQW